MSDQEEKETTSRSSQENLKWFLAKFVVLCCSNSDSPAFTEGLTLLVHGQGHEMPHGILHLQSCIRKARKTEGCERCVCLSLFPSILVWSLNSYICASVVFPNIKWVLVFKVTDTNLGPSHAGGGWARRFRWTYTGRKRCCARMP